MKNIFVLLVLVFLSSCGKENNNQGDVTDKNNVSTTYDIKDDFKNMIDVGLQLLNNKNNFEAIKAFKNALIISDSIISNHKISGKYIDPIYFEPYRHLGRSYFLTSNENAKKNYLNYFSLSNDIGSTPEFYSLGYIYDEEDNNERAEYYYNKAIENDPNGENSITAYVHYRLAMCCKAGDERIEGIKNAIEINPSIVKFHSKLGFIYVMRRDFANAKKAHNALIALGASKEAATLEKGINAYQGLQGY